MRTPTTRGMAIPDAFEARVRKVRGHWLWIGGFNKFRGSSPRRVAWELDAREIEPGQGEVLVTTCDEPTCDEPTCDEPTCVRPEHLRLVSQAEKVTMATPRGVANHNAKLTEDDVRSIRKLRAEGLTFKALATRFGVTDGAISRLLTGDNWRHVV